MSLLLLDTNIWALLVRAELGRVREGDKAKTSWYQGELRGQQLARCFATDAELERGELDIEPALRESLTQMRRALLNQASLIPSSPAISAKWACLVYEAKQRGKIDLAGIVNERRLAHVNDFWIASCALAHSLPLVSDDQNFEWMRSLGLELRRYQPPSS